MHAGGNLPDDAGLSDARMSAPSRRAVPSRTANCTKKTSSSCTPIGAIPTVWRPPVGRLGAAEVPPYPSARAVNAQDESVLTVRDASC